MVKVVAHRGFSGKYPENTGVAFREALALRVEAIELDVHLARDRAPIVIHDATVDRTSDGSGRVDRMRLKQIRALDAGSWFGDAFAGERLPTLQEALDLIGGRVRLAVSAISAVEPRSAGCHHICGIDQEAMAQSTEGGDEDHEGGDVSG